MFSYPLKFRVNNSDEATGRILVTDKDKRPILFRQPLSEQERQGQAPCTLFADETARQPLYRIQFHKTEAGLHFDLEQADGTPIGRLEQAGRQWDLLAPGGIPAGRIRLKNGWRRSCLFTLISGGALDAILFLFLPMRYEILVEGEKVLVLKETEYDNNEVYKLKWVARNQPQQELLFLLGLVGMFWPRE